MTNSIIYVRGNNKEMQEILCKIYASEQGYNVLFATDDIEKVQNCDILLISNPSRISRDEFKYNEIEKELKTKDIKIESVAHHEMSVDYNSLAKYLMQ